MRKEVEKVNNFHWRTFLSVVILIVLGVLIFFAFFSYEDCENKACFDANLRDCEKAKFATGEEMIFEYTILGKKDGKCNIDVELLQGELNNADSKKLEGKTMICSLPLGVVTIPEGDISICHGELKEGLQDLVIKKLHTYLIKNLGDLSAEILDLVSA